jgi:hypothetical protein
MASSSSQASQQMGNAMRNNNNTKKSKKAKKALPPRALSQRIANRLASKPQNMNTRNNSNKRKSMKASKKASKKSLTYAQSLRGTRSKNPQVSAAGKAFLSQLNAYKASGMSNVAAGAAAGAALASQLPVVAEQEEAYDPVMGSLASAFQGFNVKKNARNHGYQGASSSSAAPAQPVMVAPSFAPYGSGSSAPVFSFSVGPGQDKPYMGFAQPSLVLPPSQPGWLQPAPFSRA